jgi:hypothetical protein
VDNVEQQEQQLAQAAAQAGLSRTAILDVHPTTGIIRLKVNLVPLEKTREFITTYAKAIIAVSLGAANISVKTYVGEEK